MAEGHGPTSERFRKASEERLLQAYVDTGITATVVGGTLEERLEQMLDHLGLAPVMPVPMAAAMATQQRSARFDAVPLEGDNPQTGKKIQTR